MSRTDPRVKFWDVVRADLEANTGQRRLRRLVTACLFQPGFAAIFLHRVTLPFVRTPLDKLGGLIWTWNRNRSGCHFHLDSVIGPGLCLPHPVAIVIGRGVTVGTGVTLYQSVTIGRSKDGAYPVVGDGATIFPNSVIIGPIAIGAGAVVGAGSVVLKDVPPGAVVAGNPARILRLAVPAAGATAALPAGD